MTRLIDADALSKKLCETTIFIKGGEMFQRMINDAPTIEPDGDLINRVDAMGAVQDHFNADGFKGYDDGQKMMDRIKALPSAEQVTGKLNNPDDSLLTADSEACKEQKSKLDLISRQDAVNEIHKYFVEEIEKTPTEIDEDGDELYADMPTVNSLLACNKELSKRIKSLPSAPDSRQRGEWVLSHIGTIAEGFYCSRCGKLGYKTDFCPNCGADMRGDSE